VIGKRSPELQIVEIDRSELRLSGSLDRDGMRPGGHGVFFPRNK
jgi:hypothetical protein